MSNPPISVELVIPSYNRFKLLLNTLKQIRVLYPDLNICAGVQGDIVQASKGYFASDYKVRFINVPTPSTTNALNLCINSSEANIVLILDDDAVPHFGWLESHVSAFASDPELTYTCGREIRFRMGRSVYSEAARIVVEWIFGLLLKKNKTINGRIVGWTNKLGLIFGNFDQPGTCLINTPRGCNMAVRKEPFLKMGGFRDTYWGNAWGYEADFGLRMAKTGKYGRYVGDAIVVHHEVPSGGSRQSSKYQWFQDYLHNHKVLISNLGPQAWLGSLPRLAKKIIWLMMK